MANGLARPNTGDQLPGVWRVAETREEMPKQRVWSRYQQSEKPDSWAALSRSAAPRDYGAIGGTGERPNDYEHCGTRLTENARTLFARPTGRKAKSFGRSLWREFRERLWHKPRHNRAGRAGTESASC